MWKLTSSARKILEQVPGGLVDAVVSGVGTGGTLVGLLKGGSVVRHSPRAFLARPANPGRNRDAECCSFSCRIPGLLDCVSSFFQKSDIPDLTTIEGNGQEAIETTRELIRMGFPAGPSLGLNCRAAMLAAERFSPARIVTFFPDRMELSFTTDLFEPFIEASVTR